jgi:hypothetical protein
MEVHFINTSNAYYLALLEFHFGIAYQNDRCNLFLKLLSFAEGFNFGLRSTFKTSTIIKSFLSDEISGL